MHGIRIRKARIADNKNLSKLSYETGSNLFQKRHLLTSWFVSLFSASGLQRYQAVVIEAPEDGSTVKRNLRGFIDAICVGATDQRLHWKALSSFCESDLNPELVKNFLVYFFKSLYLSSQMYVKKEESVIDFELNSDHWLFDLLREEFNAEDAGEVMSIDGQGMLTILRVKAFEITKSYSEIDPCEPYSFNAGLKKAL